MNIKDFLTKKTIKINKKKYYFYTFIEKNYQDLCDFLKDDEAFVTFKNLNFEFRLEVYADIRNRNSFSNDIYFDLNYVNYFITEIDKINDFRIKFNGYDIKHIKIKPAIENNILIETITNNDCIYIPQYKYNKNELISDLWFTYDKEGGNYVIIHTDNGHIRAAPNVCRKKTYTDFILFKLQN
jgi:hypothetical protein